MVPGFDPVQDIYKALKEQAIRHSPDQEDVERSKDRRAIKAEFVVPGSRGIDHTLLSSRRCP